MPNSSQAEQLLAATKKLEESVSSLVKKTQANEEDIRSGKTKTRILFFCVVAVMFLSLMLALVGGQVLYNQTRIERIQEAQGSITNINRDGQCALINLFLQSEENVKRSPNYTAEQKADQVTAFATLRSLYNDTLDCDTR